MDLMILNPDFEAVKIIDAYKSLSWSDRYNEYGDFELTVTPSAENFSYMRQDYYIICDASDRAMIIEDLSTDTDIESGKDLVVTGRSLEMILTRRVIWTYTLLNGNIQDCIESLLNANVINPAITDRKIPNFIFKKCDDPRMLSIKVSKEYTGDTVYDAIAEMCQENDVGFKITIDDQDRFVFELFIGVNRTYDQEENPYVIFSPKFENFLDSNYLESSSEYKNVALIGGEGEANARIFTIYGQASGIDRREMYVDARDIRSDDDEGNPIDSGTYIRMLQQRGKENLDENIAYELFEGNVEPSIGYIYNRDYFIGDVVQIEDEYGHDGETRVTETLISYDSGNGLMIYPTFEMAPVSNEETEPTT